MRQSSKRWFTVRVLLSEFNRKPLSCGTAFLAALMALLYAGWFVPALSAEHSPRNSSSSQERIEITADQLNTHADQNYAEFLGNVEAAQGNFELRSDKLKIFYREGTGISGSTSGSQDALEKIVASGNVKIKSANQHAETETAEYAVDSGILILTGENTTLTDGKNLIRGSKIRLNRLTGEIRVESGEKSRVRAIVYSTRGINPSSGSETNGNQRKNAAD